MKLTILGASGSIGLSAASVAENHKDMIKVSALVAGSNAAGLAEIALRLKPDFVALADEKGLSDLKGYLSGSGIGCGAGAEAVAEAVDYECDTVLAAISGVAGLKPSFQALKPGRRMALANKESLVCAGYAFMKKAQEILVPVVPVDSEHNALNQAMASGRKEDIISAVLTASGGPFRTWSEERMAKATPEEASAHPVWSMGQKINIDSATLMNKGLELIEAHHLFALPADKLDAIVHPQSTIHAMVQWKDGAWTCEAAIPDMRIPIANALSGALSGEARLSMALPPLDLVGQGSLTFEKLDERKFRCFALARQALQAGGPSPTILNAVNEIAVQAFLRKEISFGNIAVLIENICSYFAGLKYSAPATIEDALAIDEHVRVKSLEFLRS